MNYYIFNQLHNKDEMFQDSCMFRFGKILSFAWNNATCFAS